jgi:hypothetical protein
LIVLTGIRGRDCYGCDQSLGSAKRVPRREVMARISGPCL